MKGLGAPIGVRWQATRPPHRRSPLCFSRSALGPRAGRSSSRLRCRSPGCWAPWTAATAAALAGAPLAVPAQIRNTMIAILGVLLGSQFTIDLFAQITEWYVGLSGVVLSTVAAAEARLFRLPQARPLRPGDRLLRLDAGRAQRDDGARREHGRRWAHDLAHPRHAHPRRRVPGSLSTTGSSKATNRLACRCQPAWWQPPGSILWRWLPVRSSAIRRPSRCGCRRPSWSAPWC